MEIIFTFHNTHGAMAGEQALIDGEIKVRVMALPSSLGAGCGLCLRIGSTDLEAAIGLLKASGLEPEGIYSKRIHDGLITYHPESRA